MTVVNAVRDERWASLGVRHSGECLKVGRALRDEDGAIVVKVSR